MINESKIFFTLLEDNELYAMFLTEKLKENFNCHVTTNKTLEEFLGETTFESRTDIFIIDYSLPGGNGMEAIKALKLNKIDSEIIVLSSQKDIQIAVDVLKAGAFDYIVKNDEAIERLIGGIYKALKVQSLQKENFTLKIKFNKYRIFSTFIFFILVALITIVMFAK